MPTGGDVIVEIDGEPVVDFSDLLFRIATSTPGDTLELTVIRDGERLPIAVSIGVATSDEPGLASSEALLQRADEHLYAAKAAGRNRVVSGRR